jgi:hypothetical protein
MPTFALSYLADAMAASNDRGSRYADVVRRIQNKMAIDADRAHVEEVDDVSLTWLWNTNVRATAVVLSGIAAWRRPGARRAAGAAVSLAAPERPLGHTQENAVALEALVAYYRAFEAEVPQMKATVSLAANRSATRRFKPLDDRAGIKVATLDLAAGRRRRTRPHRSREGTGRRAHRADGSFPSRRGRPRHSTRAALRALNRTGLEKPRRRSPTATSSA